MARASIGDYVVTSKLGSGSFAVVYKGYHKVSKTPVAIKALSLGKLNSKLLANLEMEIAIMRQIDHPNVVKLYEIKKTEKHMYLMLEYCAGGDLQQYMRRRQQENKAKTRAPTPAASPSSARDASAATLLLSEDTAQHFLRELAKGMQCLWQHNLIHRDLKPQNLLLVEDSPTSALKIADFGFARHLATASLAETLCGSPLYMAPEILKFQKYDAKADLWSVGTILFEMVAGRPPYGGANHVQLLANIERQPLRFPAGLQLSRVCRHLLTGLLQRKPALRLGFAEFFADPFVDLPSVPEISTSSAMLAASGLPPTDSIREEEEESGPGHWGASASSTRVSNGQETDASATQDAAASPSQRYSSSDRRARAFSVSHDSSTSPSARFSSTAPSAALRHSRSGNLEVMQTAFASTSSGAMRRSSTRLARSRRATSSGSGFGTAASGTSPRLSPQMSPSVLPNPSPSPRINPFKQLSESPPGAAALQHSTALSASTRAKMGMSTAAATATNSAGSGGAGSGKLKTVGGGPALDSSGEYVLIEDDGLENATGGGPQAATDAAREAEGGQLHAAHEQPSGCGVMPAFSSEYAQQLVDIVLLRTQAIIPIADQLWTLSAAGTALSGEDGDGEEMKGQNWSAGAQPTGVDGSALSASGGGTGGPNFSSVFSMSSSLASSAGGGHAFGEEEGEDDEDDEDGDGGRSSKRQYVCAAEALALYVKCLRLVQHGVLYLRQDPTFTSNSGSTSPGETGSGPAWSEQSRKMSMTFLTEQLNHFLTRAEQCKARMTQLSRVCTLAARPVASQEELLYAHALRLGRQGAIREVLGQSRAAHDHYLQALLLLESLLMETPGAGSAGASTSLAVDDQKNVNTFLRALEQRLKNVRALLEEDERAEGGGSPLRRLQQPKRQSITYSSHRATAAVL